MLRQIQYGEKITQLLRKDYVTNLNILGVLSYDVPARIYVDDLESPKGVCVLVWDLVYIYAEEVTFIDKVFETFKDRKEYCFSGLRRNLAEYIKSKYTPAWENPCDIYYYPHSTIDLSDVVSEVVTIPLEEATRIDTYYTYRNEGSVEVIKENLRLRPSAGVYEDDQLVCWVLVHEDNSMGIMYTMEGYRRKGYAVDVSLVLMNKLLKQGKTPYIQIVESNEMSPGLAEKCGFVNAGKCTWMGIELE